MYQWRWGEAIRRMWTRGWKSFFSWTFSQKPPVSRHTFADVEHRDWQLSQSRRVKLGQPDLFLRSRIAALRWLAWLRTFTDTVELKSRPKSSAHLLQSASRHTTYSFLNFFWSLFSVIPHSEQLVEQAGVVTGAGSAKQSRTCLRFSSSPHLYFLRSTSSQSQQATQAGQRPDSNTGTTLEKQKNLVLSSVLSRKKQHEIPKSSVQTVTSFPPFNLKATNYFLMISTKH